MLILYILFSESYEEAQRQFKKLETDEYAFSTDSELSKGDKAEACENTYKPVTVADSIEMEYLEVPSLSEPVDGYVPTTPMLYGKILIPN